MGDSFGTSKSQQQTQQSSVTNPYGAAIQPLNGILSGIQGQVGNYQPTSAETNALSTIQGNYASAPNYTTQATNLANTLTGGATQPATDALNSGYTQAMGSLAPYLNSNYLDPTQTPGIQSLLDTIRGDTTNSINGMFAGAGRDLSGLNVQALARGISQGEAQPLLNQYNSNVGAQQNAIQQLQGGSNAYAQTLQGLTQQNLANQQSGVTAGMGIPDVANNNAQGILSTASQARQLPLQNLGMLASLIGPLAGLGSSSTGTSTTTGSQTASPLQQVMGVTQALGGLFGNGTASNTGSANGVKNFFSDRRVKDDIEQIGALFDGTPVYRYRYKGDPRVSIGLMADEVEKFAPDAVVEFAGIKMVDYGVATARAASMGAK